MFLVLYAFTFAVIVLFVIVCIYFIKERRKIRKDLLERIKIIEELSENIKKTKSEVEFLDRRATNELDSIIKENNSVKEQNRILKDQHTESQNRFVDVIETLEKNQSLTADNIRSVMNYLEEVEQEINKKVSDCMNNIRYDLDKILDIGMGDDEEDDDYS